MTVTELIAKLQALPGDLEVVLYNQRHNTYERPAQVEVVPLSIYDHPAYVWKTGGDGMPPGTAGWDGKSEKVQTVIIDE